MDKVLQERKLYEFLEKSIRIMHPRSKPGVVNIAGRCCIEPTTNESLEEPNPVRPGAYSATIESRFNALQ